MPDRVYNFAAGPAQLPEAVLKKAQAELLNWHGCGMSVMEMSHRSKVYDGIIKETEAAMRRRIAKLRPKVRRLGGVDLLLTHAPARGLNDGEDLPHRGFECFNAFLDEWQPRWFVHGHIHLFYDYKLPRVCQRGETTVINATERYTFETPDLEYHPAKKFFFLESFAAMFSR